MLFMCGIFDSAIQSYTSPLTFRSRQEAVRAFGDAVRDPNPNNSFHAHSDDYELRLLATWSPESGEFLNIPPETLLRGKDVAKEA